MSEDIEERVLRAWFRIQTELAIAEERSRNRWYRLLRPHDRGWADDGGRS